MPDQLLDHVDMAIVMPDLDIITTDQCPDALDRPVLDGVQQRV